MPSVRNTLVLTLACVAATLGLIAPSGAAAAPPTITLDKEAPETALLGTNQKVTLVAHNPTEQPRGYNLTVRDVLPKGVEYVAGSAGENEPRVLNEKPGTGMTTLIFENVGDLSPNSDFTLNYEVKPSKTFFKFVGEKAPTYTNEAEAFISENPRTKPNFNANGEPIANVEISVAKSKATTELTAIEIEKNEVSPEGEILRGVHEHQRVYTLTVLNNEVGPTRGIENAGGLGVSAIVVEDWLPAGLEFLGCGTVDNTTETKTNEGSAEEYPGSGPINQATPPSAPNCQEPVSVTTEEIDPPGEQPFGVYTHVKFLGPKELATGAKFELQYVVGIPILQNTTEWLGPEPPEPGLGQIANLNNNTGPETKDEEPLTNTAQARGEYETAKVKDLDEMTRTAEDLAIQKGTEKKGEDVIFDGAETTWTLNVETSEYRFQKPVSIVDQLPDGLCPIGPKNYEEPIQPKAECEGSTTRHPEIRYLKGPAGKSGTKESIEYSNVEEESEGGFKIEFDDSNIPALEHLEPSQELQITFPTNTRSFYQKEFEDDEPVLTGDSWTNEVHTFGTGFSRCYLEEAGEFKAEPNCVDPAAEPIIPTEGPGGTPVEDFSESSQEAGGVTIEKTVRLNNGEKPLENCEGPTSEYVKGLVSEKEPTLPQYRPGDQICWRLVVRFANNIYAGAPVVSDFIPPDEVYVPGSAEEGPENDVVTTFAEEPLEWEILEGKANAVKPNRTFEYRFRTEVETSSDADPGEITGNLMKFLYTNSTGETFPERDRAEVQRQEPNLSLTKGITEVDGKTVIGAPASSEIVGGGEKVKYQLSVKNSGNLKAEEVEVWDELPEGIECTDVILPAPSEPPSVECDPATETIKWTSVTVAEGATTPLTYEVLVPVDVEPNHAFVNHAGVTQYKSETNTAEKFEYFPENNIDTALEPKANTGELRAQAEIKTTAATLKKTATTSIGLPGNAADAATIGEFVEYEVTTTIPANAVIYGAPQLTDELPANVKVEAASVVATLDGTAVTETAASGPILKPLPNGAAVEFRGDYPTEPTAAEHVLVLKMKAQVLNLAGNKAGGSVTNEAHFKYEAKPEFPARTEELSKSTTTGIVEPNMVVTKKNLLPASAEGKVAPGQTVEYETEVTNTGASTAYETEVTDTVPKGMEIANPGEGTPVGGTIVWKNLTIAPGASKRLTYSLKVVEPAPAASKFTNVAVAETQSIPDVGGLEQPETRSAKTPGATGYEAQDENTVSLVSATLKKEVTPEDGTIGSKLVYTLHLHLQPEIEYSNTTVVDQLPKGVTFGKVLGTECIGAAPCPAGHALSSEPGPNGTTLIGWYFGDFPSGPARELNVEVEAHVDKQAAKGQLTNTAGGFYNEEDEGEPTELPVPGSNTTLFNEETKPSTAVVTVHEPALTLTKSVSGGAGPGGKLAIPGNTYEYTLTVANNGDWPAYDFEVKDQPSADLTGIELLPSTGTATATPLSGPGEPPAWHVAGPLGAGETLLLHYKATLIGSNALETGEEVVNQAEVPTYFGLTPKERGPEVEFIQYPRLEAEENLEVELPTLELKKTVGTPAGPEAVAEIGKPLPWHIAITNPAAAAGLKEVSIRDTLPKGWEYVEGTTTGLTTQDPATVTNPAGEEELTWSGIELPGETSKTIDFEAVPTLALALEHGPNVNHALASGKDMSGAVEDLEGPYEDEGIATANLKTPGLSIEKTPDVPEEASKAVAGDEAAYTIKVHNGGEAVATGVEVSDVLGKGNDYTAGEAKASPEAGFAEVGVEPSGEETKVKWTIASIPANGTVTITVPVSLSPSIPDQTRLADHASVISAQETTPVTDEGSLLVERETDIAIQKSESRPTLNAGENLTYTLHVENLGPSDATGVVATDTLPTNVKVLSAPGCTEAAGALTCAVGELALNASKEFTVEVQVLPSATGSVVNKADVTSTTKDENPVNNHAEKTATLTTEAALSIDKSGPSAPVLLGSTFVYTLEVANNGPSDAQAVTVEDELPPEVEAVSVESDTPSCEPAAPTVKCELGTMVPGQKATIHVTVKAIEMPAEGKVKNTATVSSPTDPTTPESSAETTVLPAADLAITKTAPATVEPNGDLTYKLRVENLGPSPAHHVVVKDPLPAGVEFTGAAEGCAAASGTVTCEVPGELPVGGEAGFEITVHVPYALGGQSLVNTATVEGEEADPHIENNSSTATTTVGPAADLSITKTMGKAQAGDPLTYTLAVTNHGPSDSSAVTVKDTLPAGTTFKSAAPSQGTCSASGQSVTCALGPLAAGASAQVSITVEVAATATGSLRNVATVEGPEPDPDKSNNESAVEGPVSPAPPSAPNLKVVKTASTSAPTVGTPFEYHVAVTNLSGAEAKNVKVLDTLNGPAKVVSIDAESGHCSAAGTKITCNIPSIPVGKTVHIDYVVVAESSGPLSNTASAQAGNGEVAPSNNHAVKSVRAKEPKQAKYTLSKTASRKVVAGGKKVGFAITLRNGSTALTDAKICDRLPAALVFVKAPGARYVNGEACWTQKYVAAHKVLRLHLVARAVKGYKSRRARNVATASAADGGKRSAAASVRIKPAFAGKPGGVTG